MDRRPRSAPVLQRTLATELLVEQGEPQLGVGLDEPVVPGRPPMELGQALSGLPEWAGGLDEAVFVSDPAGGLVAGRVKQDLGGREEHPLSGRAEHGLQRALAGALARMLGALWIVVAESHVEREDRILPSGLLEDDQGRVVLDGVELAIPEADQGEPIGPPGIDACDLDHETGQLGARL